jgi:hypothetical protein
MRGMPVHPMAVHRANLVATAVRTPFALFWGPACLLRRAAEGFFWGSDPHRCAFPSPGHVYKITCEPACYCGCGCRRCHRG